MFGGSWKSTTIGILTIVVAVGNVAMDLVQGTQPDWEMTMSNIMLGIGMLLVRDNSVTSERAGAK